jgi:hypothetical protein
MNLSPTEHARLKNVHPDLARVIRRAALLTPPNLRCLLVPNGGS